MLRNMNKRPRKRRISKRKRPRNSLKNIDIPKIGTGGVDPRTKVAEDRIRINKEKDLRLKNLGITIYPVNSLSSHGGSAALRGAGE